MDICVATVPIPRPHGDDEAQGKPRMGNVTLESESTSRRKRISKLRQELQEAELTEAIEGVGGVLNIVTGSPATIISLDFVLKILAGEKAPEQTVQQLKEHTHKKFMRPEVSLQNYGGHRVDIMAQTRVVLSHGGCRVEAVVFVQKDAPNELLRGTDVQPQLGFSLVMKQKGGKTSDLLEKVLCDASSTQCVPTGTEPESDVCATRDSASECGVDCHAVDKDLSPPQGGNQGILLPLPEPADNRSLSTTEGEVRLLHAVKVPARFHKLVRGKIGGDLDPELLLFTPGPVEENVLLQDNAVAAAGDQLITLVIQNQTRGGMVGEG